MTFSHLLWFFDLCMVCRDSLQRCVKVLRKERGRGHFISRVKEARDMPWRWSAVQHV
jgi:hypothetical protein